MLILSRRTGESLMIGNDLVVTVLSAKGNQVRIGVTAPREKGVHREEIFTKLKDTPVQADPPRKKRGLNARLHR